MSPAFHSRIRAVGIESVAARVGRTPPQWLLEGLFIIVSVALGFGVAQYGEHRSNRELATRVLKNLQAELEHNLAILEPMVPIHGKWREALARADTSNSGHSGIDLFFAARPALPANAKSPFPFLRRSAWDAALSGGALRLIDYEVAAALSETYRLQEIATENVDRLAKGGLSSTATFDPASREASVRLLWLTLADIESAEAALLDLYRQHLPTIRAAANAER
jgi:hypothetical protein